MIVSIIKKWILIFFRWSKVHKGNQQIKDEISVDFFRIYCMYMYIIWK